MDHVPLVFRLPHRWTTFTIFVIAYFMMQQECSGFGDPKNYLINNFNKEQASRSYYPASYHQRFRRGYSGSDERNTGNYGNFPKTNAKVPQAPYQKRVNAGPTEKGGTRRFGSRPVFGGPDAFLSASYEDKQSPDDEPMNFGYSPKQSFSQIGKSGKGWSNNFNNGRLKGGGINKNAGSKVPLKMGYNFGSGKPQFGQNNQQKTFVKHGSSSSYSSSGSGSSSSTGSGYYGGGLNSPKSMTDNSFHNMASMSGDDFPNPFSRGSETWDYDDGDEIIFGSKEEFGGFSEKKKNLDGGTILGSLENLSAEDLSMLLKQLQTTTTTKKPNRLILDEDKDKIFSGGDTGHQINFGEMDKISEMKRTNGMKITGHANKAIGTNQWARTTKMTGSTKQSGGTKHSIGTKHGGGTKPNRIVKKGSSVTSTTDLFGGCSGMPTAINAEIGCTPNAGCRLNCFPNYRTISGSTTAYLKCIDGAWYEGNGLAEVPNCEPICDPACQNEGICLAPNVCSCSDDWEGAICDQSKIDVFMKCSDKPPTPMNSRIFCSADECNARCRKGYEFDIGVTKLSFECNMGNWEVKNDIGGIVPDCKPTCNSPCQNGGICIAPNVCECSSDFRGSECQYPVSNCDPVKLNFNGGYNCTGKGMDYGCKLYCPTGINFTFPASDLYTCDYSTAAWSPSLVPECNYDKTHEEYHTITNIETQTARSGMCFTWSSFHYKTFDGIIYSFDSRCTFTLLQDSQGTFTATISSDPECVESPCKINLKIFTEGDHYTLSAAADKPILTYGESSLAIPSQFNDLVVERIAHFVILKFTGIGLTIKWDLEDLIELEVSESLWNRTSGLCGSLDGLTDNDIIKMGNTKENLIDFLGMWQADNLAERCSEHPIITPKCTEERRTHGKQFCGRILNDEKFDNFRKLLNAQDYAAACEWDYCSCKTENPEDCACQSISAFVKDGLTRGASIQDNWRTEEFCAMKCKKGLVYKTCLSTVQQRCGQPSDSPATTKPEFCVEGCDCPSGTVNYDGGCVKPDDCPCTYHNKTYSAWDVIPNDCNTCTCISGKWKCTEVKCGARCSSVGDPHYKTFDGRRYDFMGKCSYYLVKGEEFSIEAENTPCAGSISEAMNFPESVLSDFPSCTKSITVRVPGTTIEMKQGGEVTVNGVEVTDLPIFEGDIYVKKASSLFTTATLPNRMEVWWDGQTRAYVDAPAEMRGKTKGLCGTFNDNQKDDFLTPEADIEQNSISFANKWKTTEKCADSKLIEQPQPCDRHVQRKEKSEKYCTRLKSKEFSKCHFEIDPDPHYRNCLYDMCSCETKLSDCMCPILASYGKECADKGIIIDWRSQYRECGIHCMDGQSYQTCGDSCSYTCYDISSNPSCKQKCVEGCACSEGFSLNSENECIAISHCPCLHEDKEYKPDYEMMHNADEPKICKCTKGQWVCRTPTDIELISTGFFNLTQVECSSVKHEIYTDCMPGEEMNCKNMHLRPELPADTCRAGCRCDTGYVRDVDSGLCVTSTSCPCHHGGKSYQESAEIMEECNTCTCRGGVWQCTTEECPARCTAWGESHFKTFDGRIYDFHGVCDYMLAKGKISKTDSFEIVIQNIPCGTNGVTCAKSVTLRIGYGDKQEVITFSRNKPVQERNVTRTIIREVGSFIFAEVADMGLVLQWDKGTIIYITLDPSWKNKVKGLCGNYNKDANDDFQTPSAGLTEESTLVFGDSWRIQNHCPESLIVKDTCLLHPHRKFWAIGKCSILRSDLFSSCHSEVPVEPYVERCQFDSCGCDTGGDCHCLCTAIAAYVQECNIYGVPVRWRRPDFCPMQCDESCQTYQPCISACPMENCHSHFSQKQSLCQLETCIEGCEKDGCLPGEVYVSATNHKCVPKSHCKTTCMMRGDKVYYEGDVTAEDDCHTCYCRNKKEICKGVPCISVLSTTPIPVISTSEYTTAVPEYEDCLSGWSSWINNDHPRVYTKNSDIEQIPRIITRTSGNNGFCQRDMITDIRCRIVGSHQPLSTSVSCNVEEGLKCIGSTSYGKGSRICEDYEISLLCDCSTTTPSTGPPIEIISTTPKTICKPGEIHIQHETDCQKFYKCDGMNLVEETCGRGTLFNPKTLVCDFPYVVYHIRHDCLELLSTTPAVSVVETTTACTDDEWTEWFNVSHPDQYGGDYETREAIVAAGFEVCRQDYILAVDCRFEAKVRTGNGGGKGSKGKGRKGSSRKGKYRKGHQSSSVVTEMQSYTRSGDYDVTCTTGEGLSCDNSAQPHWKGGVCQDYSIRFLCSCASKKTTKARPAYTTTTPTPYTDIVTKDYTTTPIMYNDWCPPGQYYNASAVSCTRVCIYYKKLLAQHGTCLVDGGYAPACVDEYSGETCPPGFFLRDKTTCVGIHDCNCMLPNGVSSPPGKPHLVSECEVCQCRKNDLVCDSSKCGEKYEKFPCDEWSPWMSISTPSEKGDDESIEKLKKYIPHVCLHPSEIECRDKISGLSANQLGQNIVCDKSVGLMCYNMQNLELCRDYEVRIVCPCPVIEVISSTPGIYKPEVTPGQTILTTTTLPPIRDLIKLKCDEWTPWINTKRTYNGDFEKLEDVRESYEELCEVPHKISCREKNSKLSAEQLGQILTCDPKVGLICRNSENVKPCYDYEVSLFCKCPEEPETTTQEYGLTTESVPCVALSPWINEHSPSVGDGDVERKDLNQLRKEYGFCKEGHITDIDCLEVNGLPISMNKNVKCDIENGLKCLNSDQGNVACLDYKIRYHCSCDPLITTRPTIIVPPTRPPTSVCHPSRYSNILDEVSDSAFKATSSQGSRYSAADSRLNNPRKYSGGAWIPAISNLDQYLQIDLGETKVIYGLYMAGSLVSVGRVTTYTVHFSNDELTWSIVEPKVLRGPVSSTDKHLALFDHPIESRFIKILPLTWSTFIAIRLEIIGCTDVTPMPITTTEGPLICSDDMGISNGLLRDSQITVSSMFDDKEDYYGKINIRLNSQLEYGGGAWVGKSSPGQRTEFVQIDFLQPSKITGVKTQGRKGYPEWVETFIIKYSHDGKHWNPILDVITGNDKIFMANYDSKTIVTTIFDRMLETRFMRLYPYSWNERIALRFEVIGCFQPYPKDITTVPPIKTTPIPPGCEACPNLPSTLYYKCLSCVRGEIFDGHKCVPELVCPCFYDGIPYPVGTDYETTDCEKCTCEMKGISSCEPMECAPCSEKDERPVRTAFCDCVCKPCPENTRLCPSSNICLEESKWCDGITNCPDDEINCPTESPPITDGGLCPPAPNCPDGWTVTTISSKSKVRCPQYGCNPPASTTPPSCPLPICPMEYIIVMEQLQEDGGCPKYNCLPSITTIAPQLCPPISCPEGYVSVVVEEQMGQSQSQDYDYNSNDCQQFRCETDVPPTAPCPPPNCPYGYDIEYGNGKNMMLLCPVYECIPKITTTKCPPVSCPDGLQTMFIKSDNACPQYTCIRVPIVNQVPIIDTCPQTVLPICRAGEKVYQTNVGEHCPLFKCRPIAVTTTESPPVVTTTCRIDGKVVITFDGSELHDLWTCNHIIARNKVTKKWNVSVRQDCTTDSDSCSQYLRITQGVANIDLSSDLSVVWNNHTYKADQAHLIGASTPDFSLSHVGNTLQFSSTVYNFSVIWDINSNIKIEVNQMMLYQIDGLCGQYTGHADDDLFKPNGQIATSIKEFQESWLVDGIKCIYKEKICTNEDSTRAFKLCNIVDSEPFTDCHDVLPPITFVKGCVEGLCECLNHDDPDEDCRCTMISSYVRSCLEKKPNADLTKWRIATKCYKECAAGEEYHDCYNYACEQSCSSLRDTKSCALTPKKSCISGCFCENGLIRKNDRCVVPEECKDCVCEIYGNSHYVTYDRFQYSLLSDCAYVIARGLSQSGNNAFEVKTKNVGCSNSTESNCSKEVTILFGDNKVQLNALTSRINVIVNGEEIKKYPAKKATASIERLNPNQVIVLIDKIQLEIEFTLDNHDLIIRAPSALYAGYLNGLCGNCNGDPTDDLMTSEGTITTVKEFGQAWITDATCQPPDEIKECRRLPPERDPCYTIMNKKLFGKCHPIEDPASYLISCELDSCRLGIYGEAYCQTLEAYARRCLQLGVCLEWRSNNICPKNCSAGMKYLSCGPGCTETCDTLQEMDSFTTQCSLPDRDGCFCDDGLVMDNGKCVPKDNCFICDDEGHRGGDVWKTDECTTCECSPEKGGMICNMKACPPEPMCSFGFKLVEDETSIDECCGPKKHCELKPKVDCPVPIKSIAECEYGKYYKLVFFPGNTCAEYICACLDRKDCPKLVEPSNEDLKYGAIWDLDTTGCCDRYVKKCTDFCPVLDCPQYYVMKERETSEEHCCPDIYCAPPDDVCIFESQNYIELEQQSSADMEDTKLYKIGEKWKDGSCINCECIRDSSKMPQFFCVAESCPVLEMDPDYEEYKLEENYLPDKCCAEITRSACIENGEVIQVNEKYIDPTNGCSSFECKVGKDGRIEKVWQVFSCSTDCLIGWEYVDSPLYPAVCCGECQQIACEYENDIKNVGDVWFSDDFCTEFTCEMTKGQIKMLTKQTQCVLPTPEEEAKYIYTQTNLFEECCAKYTITDCIVNGVKLPVDDEIADAEDKCIIYSCEYRGSTIILKEKEQTCKTLCPPGSTYVQPKINSKDCCGECVITHCVDEKKLHPVGDTWENTHEKCFKYTCQMRDDIMTTVAIKKECPYFEPTCPDDGIIQGPCCRTCNVTRITKKECQPEEIPADETIGMFSLTSGTGTSTSLCMNHKPVSGFKKCQGQCDSWTVFVSDGKSPRHDSVCNCCKPTKFSQIKVNLECQMDDNFQGVFENIEACECQRCQSKDDDDDFGGQESQFSDDSWFHDPVINSDDQS